MDLPTSSLDYPLPDSLIATRPAEPRDAARLLVVRRGGGSAEHRRVRDLPAYLRPGDHLVLNDTAVMPARFVGRRADSGGRVEGLFLEERSPTAWLVMLRSNGRLRPGLVVEVEDAAGRSSGRGLALREQVSGGWIVEPAPACDEGGAARWLDEIGRTPLPPYIRRARRGSTGNEDDVRDRRWYETIYADPSRRRSVAAPTAGLHFTPGLLAAIDACGVSRHTVTLDVGPGTFKPVESETLEGHQMHAERFEIPAAVLSLLRRRAEGAGSGRIIAVGTTTVRALESLPDPLPPGDRAYTTATRLMIRPGHVFRHVDALLTNFHLPRSTLLALVAALVGLDRLKDLYGEAIAHEYRFYSYGDAMLVLDA